MVEQRIRNAKVTSSIPVTGTIRIKHLAQATSLGFVVSGADLPTCRGSVGAGTGFCTSAGPASSAGAAAMRGQNQRGGQGAGSGQPGVTVTRAGRRRVSTASGRRFRRGLLLAPVSRTQRSDCCALRSRVQPFAIVPPPLNSSFCALVVSSRAHGGGRCPTQARSVAAVDNPRAAQGLWAVSDNHFSAC